MRNPDKEPEGGPVIVGVDGSKRSVDALALADLLGPALLRSVSSALVRTAQPPLVVIPRGADAAAPQGTTSPRRIA